MKRKIALAKRKSLIAHAKPQKHKVMQPKNPKCKFYSFNMDKGIYELKTS